MKKKMIIMFSVAIIITLLIISYMITIFVISFTPKAITLTLTNLPDDVVYVDMLRKISSDNASFNEENLMRYGFNNTASIIHYNEDGYKSFTFYFPNAQTSLLVSKTDDIGTVNFTPAGENGTRFKSFEQIKIAFLNNEGNILFISEKIGVISITTFVGVLPGALGAPAPMLNVFTGKISYDCLSMTSDVHYRDVLAIPFIAILVLWMIVAGVYFGIEHKRIVKNK